MSLTTRSRGRIESHLAKITLPPEVLALVAEELEGDVETLGALSRVSRAWCQRARDLLFRTVYLGGPKAKSRCEALLKLCTERPRLAYVTRTLSIVDTRKTSEVAVECWLSSCLDLEKLLPVFSSVEKVTLKGELFAINWDKLSSGVRSALLNLFGQKHVQEIQLQHVSYITIFPFPQFCHLKRFTMDQVIPEWQEQDINEERDSWAPPSWSFDQPSSSVTSGGLECLHLGGCGLAADILMLSLAILGVTSPCPPMLDLHHLRDIRIHTKGIGHEFLRPWNIILECYSAQVERYHIDHDHAYWEDEEGSLAQALSSLKKFPKLFSLTLTLVWEDPRGMDWAKSLQYAVIQGLKDLGDPRSPSLLREVNVIVVCKRDSYGDDDDDDDDISVTSDLQDILKSDLQNILKSDLFLPGIADVLSDATAFPTLNSFSLSFDLDGLEVAVEDWPILHRDFIEKLGKLGPMGRNVLEISYSQR